MDKPKTFTLWARVGMSFKITPENQEEFLSHFQPYPGELWSEYIKRGLLSGEITVDDETYFPASDVEGGNTEFERYVNDDRFWTE